MKPITPAMIYREIGLEIAKIKTDLINIRLEPANDERDERLERLERRMSMKRHLQMIIKENLL